MILYILGNFNDVISGCFYLQLLIMDYRKMILFPDKVCFCFFSYTYYGRYLSSTKSKKENNLCTKIPRR